jgi:hypothetical protein
MPFLLSGWRNGGNESNAPSLHRYTTADTQATVNSANYFLPVIREVKVGDFILADVDTGGTRQGVIFFVNQNTGTAIDVTDGLVIGTTDTD